MTNLYILYITVLKSILTNIIRRKQTAICMFWKYLNKKRILTLGFGLLYKTLKAPSFWGGCVIPITVSYWIPMLSPDRKFQGQIVISLFLAIGSIGYIVLLPLGPLWTFCFAKLASQRFPFFITFQPILKLFSTPF